MDYKLYWDEEAINDLNNICSSVALPLKAKIESYLIKLPQELGKSLTGKYKGLYRYRYGDYRIIYEIDKESRYVIILQVGHRKEVYH